MAVLQIPTRTDSDNYTMTVTLEGVAYSFSFVWNYRSLCWEMSISGFIDGLAIRVGVDLLAACPVEGQPPGNFVAFDTSGKEQDPGINDLGSRVLLLYRESTG
jgi:hypothetical protein